MFLQIHDGTRNGVGIRISVFDFLGTYILSSHGACHRHDENDGNEQCPETSVGVDGLAKFAQMPGTGDEGVGDDLAEDGNAITPVEGDGGDVEDTLDGGLGAEGDEVDGDTPEDGDPDGEDRSAGQWEDLGPEVREGQEAIAREGEDGATERLHSGEADELDDDEGADGKDDGAGGTEHVQENLGHGLAKLRVQILGWVAHGVAEDDIEEEAA